MSGADLRALRERLGLSQGAIAAQLGVHWVTVSRWERDVSPISPVVALAVQALTPGP